MPIDAEVEDLLDIVKNGAPLDGLRAARQLERLMRKRQIEERVQQAEREKKKVAVAE